MTTEPSNRGRLLACWSIAVAVQVGFAAFSLGYPSAFGYGGKIQVSDDVQLYHDVALPILEGKVPYRDYPVEYPVLAIPLFVAPLMAGADFSCYKLAFAVEMLLINAGVAWPFAKTVEEREGIEEVPRRLAWYSLVFAIFCPLIVYRFDLAPTLLAFASACRLAKGRMTSGGILAGVGVLVKLVPGLVIVPFQARSGAWRPKMRSLAATMLTVVLGVFGWWNLGGEGVASSFRYHGERGLEIGSLYSSAYLVAHKLAGVWVFTHFDHGSMNISGPGSGDAARLAPIVQGAFLLLVAGRARRMAPGDEPRFLAGALLAYILAGKVLSPQYLIWLVPFVGAIGGPVGVTARRVFLGCCVLTTALYPHLFNALSYFEPWPVAILAARNLGLSWLFAILIRVPDDRALESAGNRRHLASC